MNFDSIRDRSNTANSVCGPSSEQQRSFPSHPLYAARWSESAHTVCVSDSWAGYGECGMTTTKWDRLRAGRDVLSTKNSSRGGKAEMRRTTRARGTMVITTRHAVRPHEKPPGGFGTIIRHRGDELSRGLRLELKRKRSQRGQHRQPRPESSVPEATWLVFGRAKQATGGMEGGGGGC